MNRRRDILVGLVLIGAAAVAVVGTLWLQNYGWGGNERILQARFQEVGQLMEGNDVKFRGVAIGKIRNIEVGPSGDAVLVTMRIQSDVQLPSDPVVILSPESMFGDWQAQISPRSSFPNYTFAEAPEPDVLPGYALPDISQLTAAADQIADNLSTLTDRVEMAFTEETAHNIASAIDNIQLVSQRLGQLVGQQAQTFDDLANRMQASADELGSAARAARGTFQRVDTLLAAGQVDSLLTDSRAAVRSIRTVSDNLAESSQGFQSTLTRADSTFARLDRITGAIDSGQGSLGKLLQDTTVVSRAESALAQLQLLLEDFRQNPKRYVRLSIF